MAVNVVCIEGNITRTPELRIASTGMQILSFGVAVNERRRNASTGEWEDRPVFVECSMFGARAEALARYLDKGAKVCVQGKLRYSSWESEGHRRSRLDVVVEDLGFMSRGDGGGYSRQQPAQAAPAPAARPDHGMYDDDVPF